MPASLTYPTGGDYREALFNTERCFKDPVLVGGTPTLDALDMPKPISGAFGSVFTIRGRDGRRWAVKCFTRAVEDQAQRYRRISEVLAGVERPWRVAFEYVPEGVLCHGVWYPILKMEWVDACGLIPYVEDHLWEPPALADLAGKFARMVADLEALGVAHGDLQHGNLLVTISGELRLIDYDGMFVPGLEDLGASEVGHVNYQSPSRSLATWGPTLDRFSSWLIYGSLVAVTHNPMLWRQLHADGDEALLFHRDDFLRPADSRALFALEHSAAAGLAPLARMIRPLCAGDLAGVPALDPSALPAPSRDPANLGRARAQGAVAGSNADGVTALVSDWLASAGEVEQAPAGATEDPSWIIEHLPTSEMLVFEPRSAAALPLAVGWAFAVLATALLALGRVVPAAVAGLVVLGLVAVAMLGTQVAFRRHEASRAKSERRRALRRARARVEEVARRQARAERDRRDLERRERSVIAAYVQRATEARAEEQNELGGVDGKLAHGMSAFEWDRQMIRATEAKELGGALRSLQDQHVLARLERTSVRAAVINGIGPGVVAALGACGITTAADFTGIFTVAVGGGVPQVWIELRDGSRVQPRGVSWEKAQALEAWRRTVEHRARETQPNSLPAEEVQAIRTRYSRQQQGLLSQEQTARAEATQEQHWARERWAERYAAMCAEAVRERQTFAGERTAVDEAVAACRREATDAAWREKLARREVAVYARVTYARYLSGVLRGPPG
jgi:hypothetical protein